MAGFAATVLQPGVKSLARDAQGGSLRFIAAGLLDSFARKL
jgi:hypothetical protein